jgi:hypothetical protein
LLPRLFYKGRNFDPTQSRNYQALQAYFTRQGISSKAGAAAGASGNGANAAGQAAASDTTFGLPGFDLRHPFAFHVSIGEPDADDADTNVALQVAEMNSKLLMETQDEKIISLILDTSLAVENLERYIEGYIDPYNRVDQQAYELNRAKFLDEIKGSYTGFAKDDFPVPIDILESDLARVDSIFQT